VPVRPAKVSRRNWRVYMYIRRYIERYGIPPTFREIAKAMGFRSIAAVQIHLARLEAAGYIKRLQRRARGITITNRGTRKANRNR
jgi:repressor LexA